MKLFFDSLNFMLWFYLLELISIPVPSKNFFFLFKKETVALCYFLKLIHYFCLCQIFVAACQLSPVEESRDSSLVAVRRLLIVVASLVAAWG